MAEAQQPQILTSEEKQHKNHITTIIIVLE